MNIDNLDIVRMLITDVENHQVEFKETTGQLERGMESICAFLNGEGGNVLFGVTDNGKIIGQEVADKTKRNIAEAISRLEPMAAVQISYIPLPDSDKKIIALHVEASKNERPFSYKGRPYCRIESITTTMPQTVYNELLMLRESTKYRWELLGNTDLTLEDIDENEVLKTVRLGIECGRLPENTDNSIPLILEKFGLLKNGILNHAAAILFANKELIEYPQCLLRLARFRGTDKMVFMDNQRIQGNLFNLLDAAMAFVFKHLSLSGVIEGLEREEHLTIPYKAIREGIINSLCHRTYKTVGGSVGVAIYDDRVEIENPGTFPRDWNVERMKSEHHSEPQNPIIANVLYKRKLLESWGRGISLMVEECKKAGLPEPEYKLDGSFVVLVFRYKHLYPTSTQQVPDKYPTSTQQTPDEYLASDRQVPYKYPTSTRQAKSLVKLIGYNAYSVKELMALMQLNDRMNFLNNYLSPLIEAGLVESIYPNQPKHPRQQYRLTEKGKALLQ